MRDYTPELNEALAVMRELLSHVRAFDSARLSFSPAVIDDATGSSWRGEDTQGLRKFTDSIEQHGAQLEAVSVAVVMGRRSGLLMEQQGELRASPRARVTDDESAVKSASG